MANSTSSLSPATVFARPAPERAWLGPSQRVALGCLMESSPLKLLTGPRSSGKTVLLAHLRARLLAAGVVLRCEGPLANAAGVLSSLLHDAELGSWPLGESDQRNLLAVFIEQRRLDDERVIILIDHAHRLGAGAWDELDRLRRFNLRGSPAVELVIAATPAGTPGTLQLPDWMREAAAAALPSASPEDVASYIEWRFARQGLINPFRPVAMRLIARLTGGRYGAIDALCQMAMILMHQDAGASADATLIQQAVDRLAALRRARTGLSPSLAPGDIEAAAGPG